MGLCPSILQQQIEEAGLDAREFVTSPQWMGSVRFFAGRLRTEGLLVGYDPIDTNPYHGEVSGNFSRRMQIRLPQLCEWFVPIEGVTIVKSR
jgi:hypothetical protein